MTAMAIQHFLQETALGHQLKAEECIYIAPDIPHKKLLGAQYYLPPNIERSEILLVLDDTLFGSAKAGLTLTESGLFYRPDFGSMCYFPFYALKKAEAHLGVLNHDLILNQGIVLNLVQPSRQGITLFAQLLNSFLVQLHGKAQSSSQSEDHSVHEDGAMSIDQACSLLKLDPKQLNRTSLKQAYRKQIADFHPDLYQQLPTAVQVLLIEHAQKLNQARDLLQDELTTSE